MMGKTNRQAGFTIVELLIVIVVIGILAAITIVAYNGVQDRARTSKIQSDTTMLQKAVVTARAASGDTQLGNITGSWGTAGACVSKPSGTDLSTLDKSTDACWTRYATTLDKISTASGVNVRNLVDPWGWPYFIDENETEAGAACGSKDAIGTFTRPIVSGTWSVSNRVNVPYVTAGC